MGFPFTSISGKALSSLFIFFSARGDVLSLTSDFFELSFFVRFSFTMVNRSRMKNESCLLLSGHSAHSKEKGKQERQRRQDTRQTRHVRQGGSPNRVDRKVGKCSLIFGRFLVSVPRSKRLDSRDIVFTFLHCFPVT